LNFVFALTTLYSILNGCYICKHSLDKRLLNKYLMKILKIQKCI